MMVEQVKIKRGTTYRRLLLIRSGDASAASCRMVLKRAASNAAPGDEAPAAAEFVCVYVTNSDPADLTSPPAFVCTLAASATEDLAVGTYKTDARIEIAGDVIATATETIEVIERVTEDG
ncbi:MAG: hypothetical protein JHC81_04935 [Brevundimonas sp.]|uniref:hypothetical protein n=1 Tax=Brevundimonas sp. TaxID=1871086 RepID=UPI001A215D72|nr:hypothetical protein [Brevundimonas sp.]MBJ7446860.1 hypothetical protein [Brevundimonas sp.]